MPENWVRALLWAAALLGPERLFYIWITRAPGQLQRVCALVLGRHGVDAVTIVRWCFLAFKVVQLVVIAWWCGAFGPAEFGVHDMRAAVAGGIAIAAGQLLNLSAFYRLGAVGILYGGQFGRDVPVTDAFPYSVFRHPQYLGVAVSIWGVCLMFRFPHEDWWVLPVLETAYYSLSGHFERVHE